MAILISVASFVGCREAPGAAPFVVRDSAGIRIMERTPAAEPPDRIELVAVPFSADLPEFGDILDVALAPDDRVVVLDPLGPHVVVLDSTGTELGRFGGDGAGPGEFRAAGLTELVVLGDVVAVPDIMGQRVTLFTLDGRVLQTVAVPVAAGLAVDWLGEGDDRMVFRRVSVPQRLEMLTLGSPGFDVLTDLSSLSLPPQLGPLTPLPVWCRLPDDRLVLGRTDRYSLQVLDGGVVTSVLRGESEERPITEDDWQHLQELLAQSLARRLGQEVAPDRVRQLLEQTPPPTQAPQLAELRCSSEGEIWVQRTLPVPEMGEDILRVGSTEGWGASHWDVFHPEGETLRSVELPSGSQLTRVTDHVLVGYTTDEYGRKSPARWRRD